VGSLYRRTAHNNLTHRRRLQFHALPLAQQSVLSAPPINYPETLSRLDDAIEHNAEISEAIFRHAIEAFGIDPEVLKGKEWLNLVTADDLDKVRSTIKQLYRDWSAEGETEREACNAPVMKELEERFGHLPAEDKAKISVLVPGSGLGRLAFEIAVAGYSSQGNENSFHQLMTSNYILNCTSSAQQHTLHPFVSSFSNHRFRENQLRGFAIPDVHPGTALTAAAEEGRFSMAAGDFVAAYNNSEAAGQFDAVATVFFIDTAVNIFSYLETIWNTLVDGGVWINCGPLLWHWENREADLKAAGEEAQGLELTVEEVLEVAKTVGFRIEKRTRGRKAEYIGTGDDSMLSWVYESEFWVAIKVSKEKM
jgi:carnosine N-methyltransferase